MEKEIKKNFDMDFGPPGTGKTYNTVIYAAAIAEGKTYEEVKNETLQDAQNGYPNVLKRFYERKEKG